MNPLLILLLSMAIVIFVVLRYRLHAFLALLCGATVAGALTSSEGLYSRAIRQRALQIVQVEDDRVTIAEALLSDELPMRATLVRLTEDAGAVEVQGDVQIDMAEDPRAPTVD